VTGQPFPSGAQAGLDVRAPVHAIQQPPGDVVLKVVPGNCRQPLAVSTTPFLRQGRFSDAVGRPETDVLDGRLRHGGFSSFSSPAYTRSMCAVKN
jgi:hypothetical protein